MPTMANITVKAANGTTDVVFTGLNPSSGDNVPALWRAEALGANAAAKPVATLQSRWNGPKTARRVEFDFSYPQTSTDTTTGLTSVVNQIPMKLSAVIPMAVPDATVAEAVALATNLLASILVRDSLKSGFAPA